MANTKLADMTASSGIEATDLLYTLKDPAGSPLDRKATGTQLSAFIVAAVVAAAADTQVLFMDGTGISGDAGLTYNKTTNALTITGGALTDSAPALNITQTWNDVADTFVAANSSITSTASAAASMVQRWQVGGTTILSIGKDGRITWGDNQVALLPYIAASGLYGPTLSNGHNAIASFGNVGFSSYIAVALIATAPLGWVASGAPDAGTVDVALYRDAAGVLAQRNAANAQTFRVYNTWTDADNYERATFGWSSNVLEIGMAAAGSGSARQIKFTAGNANAGLLFNVASAYEPTIYTSGDSQSIFIKPGSGSSVWIATGGSGSGVSSISALQLKGAVSNMCQISSGRQHGINIISDENLDETAVRNINLVAQGCGAANATHIAGAAVTLTGGVGASGSAGAAHGGNVTLDGGQGFGTGHHGNIIIGATRGGLRTPDSGELTIATGAVTRTGIFHTIDTQADAASDDLDTINGGEDGQHLTIMAEHTDRTVVVTNAGNIVLSGGASFNLDAAQDTLTLLYVGALSKWVQIAASSNA